MRGCLKGMIFSLKKKEDLKMQHKCRVEVIDKKLFADYQEKYPSLPLHSYYS